MTATGNANNTLRVFVLCPSYHGATLLAVLLSQHPDVVDLADTNPRRDRDIFCRCGQSVQTCSFWRRLEEELRPPVVPGDRFWFPKRPPYTPYVRLNTALSYTDHVVSLLSKGHIRWPTTGRLSRYREAYDALVGITAADAGARVFVDGEKVIEKALYLSRASDGPVRFIHLTRDPRGYVLSESTRRDTLASRSGRLGLAMNWRRYHAKARLACRLLGADRSLRIRYEDLASRPDATMARVLAFVGVPASDENDSVGPRTTAHMIGNKMLKTFDGSIRLDERWRDELDDDEAAAILREAGGFAAKLGYGR